MEKTLVNLDVDRHSLKYRVASLTVLGAYLDAKALGKNSNRYFAKPKNHTRLYFSRQLSAAWKDFKAFVESPVFEGMVKTVGLPVNDTRERFLAVARGLHDG